MERKKIAELAILQNAEIEMRAGGEAGHADEADAFALIDVLAHVNLPGSLFLAGIALVPFLVSKGLGFQSAFGGTSVLIVVGVLLDTIAQIEQHRTLRKYDSLMMKGRVRFRGRQQRYI